MLLRPWTRATTPLNNSAHDGVSADAIAETLRDEALGEMIKNHTTNGATLDLASDALTTIHFLNKKYYTSRYIQS